MHVRGAFIYFEVHQHSRGCTNTCLISRTHFKINLLKPPSLLFSYRFLGLPLA
jgi:hypothetical protein